MKKISLFSAVLAAGLMFPLAGAAQQPAPQAPAPQREARTERRQRPQLTDQQREQMRALHEAERTTGETSRRELRELHAQLSKELSAAQINSGRVNELKGQISQKQAAATSAQIDRRAKVASLLTPEQRQAMGERGARMLERGPRGPRGMRGAQGARGQAMRRQAMRGHGMRGPHRPGARGQMMRQRGGDADLREQVKRLEAQVEELRKKIK